MNDYFDEAIDLPKYEPALMKSAFKIKPDQLKYTHIIHIHTSLLHPPHTTPQITHMH